MNAEIIQRASLSGCTTEWPYPMPHDFERRVADDRDYYRGPLPAVVQFDGMRFSTPIPEHNGDCTEFNFAADRIVAALKGAK